MAKHKNGGDCESCQEKMAELCPVMHQYALSVLKQFSDCHISTAFRNKEDQNRAFITRKSRLKWPESKHNIVDESGLPNAEAMDLFQLDKAGSAIFDIKYYQKVWDWVQLNQMKMSWGGMWKTLKDFPHFELKKGK